MYKKLLRPLLFTVDPERIHNTVMLLAGAARSEIVRLPIRAAFDYRDPRLSVKLFGIDFPNPLGLAAGFDKDAEAVDFFSALGFGFIEVGTVTPRPQPGNPKPRIFRLPQDGALINRMGFPSEGAEVVAKRLSRPSDHVRARIGVNIGKNKSTLLEQAADDYAYAFSVLKNCGDFFVVNVSSPNTPELRKLQHSSYLADILQRIQELNKEKKPLLVKIAPDLSYAELDDVLECCMAAGVSGIVAANTTVSREGLSSQTNESGGLSGRPLKNKAREFVSHIAARTEGRLPIIAVGGVSSAVDMIELMRRGASLVQVYTAFIYEGPAFVKHVCRELSDFLDREGLSSISQIRP